MQIGIDLGGTKIEGVILKSADEPEVLFRDWVPTEADQGYEHILAQSPDLSTVLLVLSGTAIYIAFRLMGRDERALL